jgi:hypothetical protein
MASAFVLRPPDPSKRKAPGARPGATEGGFVEGASQPLRSGQCLAAARGSSLKLAPIWSDEGTLVGWFSLGEAALAALLKLTGGAP